MSRMLSRLFRSVGQFFGKHSQAVIPALEKALEQRALFQIEIKLENDRFLFQHLNIREVSGEEITLVSPTPFFMTPAPWQGKVFRFRFLTRPHPSEPPQLHMFRATIANVDKDKKTITVAVPRDILVIEQRRNVRIKPIRKHLPSIVVWGVHKNHAENSGVKLSHRVILELGDNDDEIAQAVKNISAGGMRLSIPAHILSRNKEWLAQGRKLIIQLIFPVPDRITPSRHLYVAKIINARTEGTNRPEFGIQFLASRVSDPNPRWKALEDSGCEDLARVIHSMQLQYHTESKQLPQGRGGMHHTARSAEQPPATRHNA